MANKDLPVHYVTMESNQSKQPATVTKFRSRRCATKLLGVKVALVAFGYDGKDLFLPFKKSAKQQAWTLLTEVPFLEESIDDAALRLYKDHVPQQQSSVVQVHAFGDANYVRTRWITVVYFTIVSLKNGKKKTSVVEWFPMERRPLLTRLEDLMIDAAQQSLQRKVRHEPIGIYMLPSEFTLQQLQRMYELLLGQPISKPSFKKKMWESEILIPLEETVTESGRSQQKGLYRFNKKKYYELKRKGFFLDL